MLKPVADSPAVAACRPMMPFPTRQAFNAALAALPEADEAARHAARLRQGQLCKPAGSLGRLEEIAVFMAGWQESLMPVLRRGQVIVFAGNHGIARHGVSAFPMEITAAMVRNFQAEGAAVNALARTAGLDFKVVALDLDQPTADFTEQPAMSEEECLAALSAGAAAVGDDLDLLVIGEMGIGNTTAAAALSAHIYGGPADRWVGRGTGVDDAGLARKRAVVNKGLARHASAPRTALDMLRCLGGREMAAMAGAVLSARLRRIPVLLDGFICCAAIAPLAAANPAVLQHCLAGHCSDEPGHRLLLQNLNLAPLLSLNMRLGEASGATLAALLVRAALNAHNEMARIDDVLGGRV